jgi:hypothetical protein
MCRLNLYRNFRTPNFYSRVQKWINFHAF